MIKSILRRCKVLLGIEDTASDEKLIYMIDSAINQVQAYIHSNEIVGLESIIAQLACHLFTSGEGEGSGGGTPTVGEVKKESYSGVSFEYTTSADFDSSSSSSTGESTTYFSTMIAPQLKGRRRVQVIHSPAFKGDL